MYKRHIFKHFQHNSSFKELNGDFFWSITEDDDEDEFKKKEFAICLFISIQNCEHDNQERKPNKKVKNILTHILHEAERLKRYSLFFIFCHNLRHRMLNGI